MDAQLQQQVNLVPQPREGYAHTPEANGSGNNQTAGASFRMVTDLEVWDLTQMTNTPGQWEIHEVPITKIYLKNGPRIAISLPTSLTKK